MGTTSVPLIFIPVETLIASASTVTLVTHSMSFGGIHSQIAEWVGFMI